MMRRIRTMIYRPIVFVLLQAIVLSRVQGGESPDGPEVVFRLIHPDRQAAAIIQLFEGCRAPHPAAALAAWKRATRDPNQLGKPLEAVISFFNPEMVRVPAHQPARISCITLRDSRGHPLEPPVLMEREWVSLPERIVSYEPVVLVQKAFHGLEWTGAKLGQDRVTVDIRILDNQV